jgi:hypothetical protein
VVNQAGPEPAQGLFSFQRSIFYSYRSVLRAPLPNDLPPGLSTVGCQLSAQKNERPVGGPAARAWGMEGRNLELIRSSGRSVALASNRTTYRSNQAQTFLLRKPRPTPDYSSILLSTPSHVDRTTGSFSSVLLVVLATLLVPPCFSPPGSLRRFERAKP